MKTSMKTALGALALAATIAGAAGVATAGKKQTYNVVIDPVAMTASGAMGDARRSADASQNITITITAMENFTSAMAAFSNASGLTRYCGTTDPRLVSALQSVESDGHVAVKWDASGVCTVVNVYTSSSRSVKEQ